MMKNISAETDQITYVAFLRGINVGGNTLIKMEDLRNAFESYGYRNVKTVLASGNVIFDAPPKTTIMLSQNIAEMLHETFGHEILAIVRSMEELRGIGALDPFKDAEAIPGSRLFVTFVSENIKHQRTSSPSVNEGFRIMQIDDGIIGSILYEQPGVGAVDLMSAIEKVYGKNVTTRSWNTIIRLLKISYKKSSSQKVG